MSLKKSQEVLDATNDYGCVVDDMLERSATGFNKLAGKKEAYVECIQLVTRFSSLVDSDLDKGKYKGLSEVQVSKQFKKYLSALVTKMQGGASKISEDSATLVGEQKALKEVIGFLDKRRREIEAKIREEESSKDSATASDSGYILVDTSNASYKEVSSSSPAPKRPTIRMRKGHPGKGVARERRKAAR